ncbi:hypothetical protein GCM10010112_71980 [Actinoplanes lobatus]|uniref:Uncharacterized protein n=1 Tax=Actinoplanes lobatus TaxID=113568 RepID=A0A7W7MJY0_9ACTN|nr:hypothetical protein [Actinoplanes lobatus]MBB4752821.1 hypothetical protein [Actinoplanes lobatus]GGN88473.1 hypothetical protein GCM10010112_71980 [Actinoplanes lobatus]GIE39431.1 hypothetical protein Alo02nite_23290 [Actinoplanes lobatus]
MTAGLDDVPWDRLHHAYGVADDVPDMLRALRDPDPEVRGDALGGLHATVLHQGTRFQASQAVVPFLVALIDDPATPGRGDLLRLLTGLAIGDRRDDRLPFDPATELTAAARLDGADTADLVRRFHEEQDADDFSDEEFELMNLLAARWEDDCYHRAAAFQDVIVSWIGDPESTVAARAAALAAWFPLNAATVSAWLAVPAGREQPRASANLALAHVRLEDPRIDRLLDGLLDTEPRDPGIVTVTAAVATAYRKGEALSPAALTVLIETAHRDPIGEATGWSRALRGFVMLALHRLGLHI